MFFFDMIVYLILYLYFQGYISNFFSSVFSFKASLIAEEAMMISSFFFFLGIYPRPFLNYLFMTFFDFNGLGTVVRGIFRYVFLPT